MPEHAWKVSTNTPKPTHFHKKQLISLRLFMPGHLPFWSKVKCLGLGHSSFKFYKHRKGDNTDYSLSVFIELQYHCHTHQTMLMHQLYIGQHSSDLQFAAYFLSVILMLMSCV